MTTPVLLDPRRLRARLVDNGPFAALDVVPVTGSTNGDLIAAAHSAADRTVLIAEEQEQGRGRLGRSWVSPRGYGLHISVLLRPSGVDSSAVSWLPLIAGVALADTVRNSTGLSAALKWPNDLLLGDGAQWHKAAGILAESVSVPEGLTVVVGIGINVHHGRDELPTGAGGLPATSLAEQGAEVDRERFAGDLLLAFSDAEQLWREHRGDVIGSGLLDRYQRLCGTLGRHVRVELGGAPAMRGLATEIDSGGRLLVRGADGAVFPIAAGDVVHLRPS